MTTVTRPRSRRRRWIAVTGWLVIVAVAMTLTYRRAYGTWWQTPERIDVCGRTFVEGFQGLTRDRVEHDGQQALVEVSRVPPIVGAPALARLTPEGELAGTGTPCTMAVYLERSDGTHTAYGLSGGP